MTVVLRLRLDQILSRDPEVMDGVPVFAGTRVPVQSLINHLLAGDTLEEFLDGFPSVSRLQAESFLELAAQTVIAGVGYAHPVG